MSITIATTALVDATVHNSSDATCVVCIFCKDYGTRGCVVVIADTLRLVATPGDDELSAIVCLHNISGGVYDVCVSEAAPEGVHQLACEKNLTSVYVIGTHNGEYHHRLIYNTVISGGMA